jgi:hypothetical protein
MQRGFQSHDGEASEVKHKQLISQEDFTKLYESETLSLNTSWQAKGDDPRYSSVL